MSEEHSQTPASATAGGGSSGTDFESADRESESETMFRRIAQPGAEDEVRPPSNAAANAAKTETVADRQPTTCRARTSSTTSPRVREMSSDHGAGPHQTHQRGGGARWHLRRRAFQTARCRAPQSDQGPGRGCGWRRSSSAATRSISRARRSRSPMSRRYPIRSISFAS